MYLKRLELYGFKSFAGRTVLLFDPGLTAVVGPNGSGKSNLADALRWVLGEQSARSLRGSRMEDVIFGGSQQERPLGYAEVAITFDNQDGRLRFPSSEVTLRRRLYRSGESEYVLGGSICRLRDIQDLLLDQGVAGGAFLVGQGEIDALVSAHPQERRLILEDLAGIARFRRRRQEAEDQLAKADRELNRLADLLAGLTAEVETTRPQVEAGLLRLRKEIEQARLEEMLLSRRQEGLESARHRLAVRQQAADDRCRQWQSALDRLQRALRETNELVDRLQDEQSQEQRELGRWHEQRERLSREQARLEQESTWLGQQQSAVEKQQAEGVQQLARARETLQQLDERRRLAAAAVQQASAAYLRRQARLEEERAAWLARQAQVDQQVKAADQARRQREESRRRAERLQERLVALQSRYEQERASREALQSSLAQSQQDLTQMAADVEELKRTAAELDERQTALHAQTVQAEREQARLQERLQSLRTDLQTREARWQTLSEWGKEGEGLPQAVRAVLVNGKGRDWEVVGLLADLLKVPGSLAVAVEVALGSAQLDIVVPTAEDARRAIEYLRQHRLGRATFLPLDALRVHPLPPVDRQVLEGLPSSHFLGLLHERVDCPDLARKACEYLLGRWALFPNLEVALPVSRRLTAAVRCVTLAGDVIIPGGAVSGGSVDQDRRPGRVRQHQQLAQLEKEIEVLRQEVAQVSGAAAAAAKDWERLAAEEREVAQACAVTAERVRQAQKARRSKEDEFRQLQDRLRQQDARLQAIAAEQAQVGDELARLGVGQPGASQEAAGTARVPDSGSTEEERAWQEALAVREQVQRQEQQAQEELRTLEREQLQAEAAWRQLEHQFREIQRSVETLQGQLQQLQEEQQKLSQRRQVQQARWAQIVQQLEELSQEQQQRERHLEELGRARKEAVRKRHQYQEESARLEAALAREERIRSRRQAAQARLQAEIRWSQQRQQQTHARLQSLLHLAATVDMPVGAQTASVGESSTLATPRLPLGRLRQQLAALEEDLAGSPPLPTGLFAEYRRQRERVEELRLEQDDVIQARRELQEWMEQEDQEAARRLQDSFRRAQESFAQTFTALFGGGQAELAWVGDEPLTAGVEIHVQPPGKRLQNLSLLSGGEKALTALAFLLGVAALKPPPVCVLDEADSALDEANLARFLSLLETSARQTQFLLITHRRTTMERAGSLYGVTMDKNGVSRVYAYQLQEGEPRPVPEAMARLS
ncbi:MAG: chromosome segregation protein SMC [Limnochordaceae bacterium]|nr:chromosome segregation protein SMC [Limnochordaceae bacterium]